MTPIRIGFMRLTDSVPLVAAQELGLFEAEGLAVTLRREVSWANLRDKLLIGEIDAAHLLSPLAISASLGIGSPAVPLLTGLSLGLNGNSICLSLSIFEAIEANLPADWASQPTACAQALAALVHKRAARHLRPLTFASVYPFSMHTVMLRMWLRAGGLDSSRDIRLITLPPEQMVSYLSRGEIDGFCAGAPWSTVASQDGLGVIISSGYRIWNNAPEKVLAVTRQWHQQHSDTHLALRMALMRAMQWLDADLSHRQQAAIWLSQPEYLDLPLEQITPALCGQLKQARWLAPSALPDMHVFHRYQAAYPWPSHGLLAMAELLPLLPAGVQDNLDLASTCCEVFRTDLYQTAAQQLGWPAPPANLIYRPENDRDAPLADDPLALGANRTLVPLSA